MRTKLFLTSVPALFLATGAVNADERCSTLLRNAEAQQSEAETEAAQRQREIAEQRCELGQEYICGKNGTLDTVYIGGAHILSDLAQTIITVETPLKPSRVDKRSGIRQRYPVVKFDLETRKLTLNGKPCRPTKTEINQ